MDDDRQLSRQILRNTLSQMAGRLLITACRFLIAILIVRLLGAETFGQYALVLSLLLIGDCLVDFGLTDLMVRRLCQQASPSGNILRHLVPARLITVLFAMSLILGWMLLNGYPRSLLQAGLLGGLELVAYAFVVLFRTLFKSLLLMEREILAELVSVLLSLPLFWLVARTGAGVLGLIGCYVLSRLVFALLVFLFGRRELWRLRTGPVTSTTSQTLLEAAPLGLSALTVSLYLAMDPILLASLVDLRSVGLYAGCERFLNLLVLLIFPVADSLFPVLSRLHGKDPARFKARLEEALRAVAFLSAGGYCAFFAGAPLLLGLMGEEFLNAVTLLQVMAMATFLKGLASIMGPVIITSGGIRVSFWLTAFAVSVKVGLLLFLVPRFGIMGAAAANIGAESLNLVLTTWVARRRIGFWINWGPALLAALLAGLVVLLLTRLELPGHLSPLLVALSSYFLLALGSGLLPWRLLWKRFTR